MHKDNFENLDFNFDIVFSLGSFYVLDDKELVNLFRDIKKSGVKEIIDFHYGYMNSKSFYSNFLRKYISRILRYSKNKKIDYIGKFHGFSINKDHLLKLYKEAGWTPIKTMENPFANPTIPFTCILN